ncbi:hypothetical protein bthur0013_13970 [Bacillus thuringiensis IBL 200]|nr:hypothetical protein bthur0013_13970 [Bacillus thuringiensis IBL 200]
MCKYSIGGSDYGGKDGENFYSYINNTIYLSFCCAIVIYT